MDTQVDIRAVILLHSPHHDLIYAITESPISRMALGIMKKSLRHTSIEATNSIVKPITTMIFLISVFVVNIVKVL